MDREERIWNAITAGNTQRVKGLLDICTPLDLKCPLPTTGRGSALMRAAELGRTDLIAPLVLAGANLDERDQRGDSLQRTALGWACEHGHTETALALMQYRCDVNASDQYGSTPLILAASNGHTEMAQMLVALGAEIDHRDQFGLSALMRAAQAGYPETVRELLDLGANRNLRDQHDRTAVEMAFTADVRTVLAYYDPLEHQTAWQDVRPSQVPPVPTTSVPVVAATAAAAPAPVADSSATSGFSATSASSATSTPAPASVSAAASGFSAANVAATVNTADPDGDPQQDLDGAADPVFPSEEMLTSAQCALLQRDCDHHLDIAAAALVSRCAAQGSQVLLATLQDAITARDFECASILGLALQAITTGTVVPFDAMEHVALIEAHTALLQAVEAKCAELVVTGKWQHLRGLAATLRKLQSVDLYSMPEPHVPTRETLQESAARAAGRAIPDFAPPVIPADTPAATSIPSLRSPLPATGDERADVDANVPVQPPIQEVLI